MDDDIIFDLEHVNNISLCTLLYYERLLKEKGHTYEFINDDIDMKTKNKKLDDVSIEEIYNAESCDKNNIGVYLNAKIGGYATKEDKLIIEKFMFKNIWKIDYFDCDLNILYCTSSAYFPVISPIKRVCTS